MMVVGSIAVPKRERIYHRENCMYAKRIKPKNCIQMNLKQAEKYHYCECQYCGGLIGEVRTKKDKISSWEEKYGIRVTYQKNSNTLYIQTEIGFWKLFPTDTCGKYLLYHRNTFDKEMSFAKAVRGAFHRQCDVKAKGEIDSLVNYIVNHDRAKTTIMDDYRKLPRSTKRQKKYYRQAERRERKKAYRRLESLFAMIENENPGIRELAMM